MEKRSFKAYLNETPIGDYQTIGDWSKNSSFRDKRDRMLIQNKRTIDMVKKKFGNTDYLFHFYFVNNAMANRVTEEGLVKPEWVKERLGDEVYNALMTNMEKEDDAINVIFTNNKGAERKNMTAWIMAHRIGHALARERGSRRSFAYQQCSDYLIGQLAACMGFYGKSDFPDSEKNLTARGWDSRDSQNSRKNQLILLSFIYEVGNFRSAREKEVRDWFEILNELIAQYLTTGKISFRKAPQRFELRGPKGFSFATQEVDEVDELLGMLGRDMEYYIDNMLGSVANSVLVM